MPFKELPLDFWEGCTPEEVLANVVSEMDLPIQKIKFGGKLLSLADVSEEDRTRALETILDEVAYLKSIKEATREYISKLNK